MRSPSFFASTLSVKLYTALTLGVVCSIALAINPDIRNVETMQRAWSNISFALPFGIDASKTSPANKRALPSISAGAPYYAVSQDARGKDDVEFDKKVMSFVETSQARLDLLVATLESNSARAKTCANTIENAVCAKLNSIMTDAVTSLSQAELAIEVYQKNGIVSDPLLLRLQQQVKEVNIVALRYPGIGPTVDP